MCLWDYQCIGRREKEHMAEVHLKIRRLQRYDLSRPRVFRNPTAGDALPFYVRCPSIFSSEIALRATHPLPGSSDKSASGTPDGRLIFPSDCWGREAALSRDTCTRRSVLFLEFGMVFIRQSRVERQKNERRRATRFCYSTDGMRVL